MKYPNSVEVITNSPEQTQDLGLCLGQTARVGDVLLLTGELGTGKTCLTQGILWGLGSYEYARSPTFVLATQYEGRLTLHHIDLYRLDTLEEIDDLGLDEYLLGEGMCVVEWGEKGEVIFPETHIKISLESLDENKRRITASADIKEYEPALACFQNFSRQ